MMAIAVEHSNLHRRIALNAMRITGTSPRLLMLGFMIPTGLLSMWINNTASAAMMVPILEAVLQELESSAKNSELKKLKKREDFDQNSMALQNKTSSLDEETLDSSSSSSEEEDTEEEEEQSPEMKAEMKRLRNLRAMLAMAVCYSANVGGTGTLVGTPPNVILIEYLEPFEGHPLTFSSWIGFALPSVIICLIFVWIWLQIYFLGFPCCGKGKKQRKVEDELDDESRKVEEESRNLAVRKVIKRKCDELGPINFHEGSVLVAFLTCMLLWFFRSPGFITGWGDLLETTNLAGDATDISDATPAILVSIFLFVFPAKPYFLKVFKFGEGRERFQNLKSSPALLTWKAVSTKMPWGVVLLLGGGFALAEGSQKTCLSAWIGDQMQTLDYLDEWVLVLVVCLITGALTQICSNAASATMLLPVLRDVALKIEMNPLYLMLPPTLVTSYAFMLPVSTGPNAVCFTPSGLTIFKMVKLGAVMNLLCLGVVQLCINTYGYVMFDLGTFPDWAQEVAGENSTDFCHASPVSTHF